MFVVTRRRQCEAAIPRLCCHDDIQCSLLSCSWYVLTGHELIWKNREPLVKLWHELRTRGGR